MATLKTAAVDELRDAHYIDGVRHTLLEPQRTGQLSDPTDVAAAGWTTSSSPTLASATSIIDGKTARKVTATLVASRVQQTSGVYTGSAEVVVALLEAATGNKSTKVVIQLWDSTASAQVGRLELDTTNGAVSNVAGADYIAVKDSTGPNGETVWRVEISATGTTGNSRTVRFFPDAASGSGAVVVHYLNWEEGSFGTSPITDSLATRAVDIASYALPDAIADPRTPWVRYTRWVAGMDGNGGASFPFIWQVGDGATSSPRLYLYWETATQLRLVHASGSFKFASLTGLSTQRGDTCEAAVRWNGDGTATLAVSINGGTVQSATLSSASPASAWNGGANTYLNSRDGGNNAGAMALRDDKWAYRGGRIPYEGLTDSELMTKLRNI